jgi:hypothetical protein
MGLFGKKPTKSAKSVELGPDLFKRINRLLGALPGEDVSSKGIAFFSSSDSEKQRLDVVGESFCQEDIKKNFKPDRWLYGLLVPEQNNEYDPNAVAIYLITKNDSVVKVGYLKKDSAQKVSQKIANLMVNEGLVIPLLAIIKKGPEESSNFGVQAYAMTDRIVFQ